MERTKTFDTVERERERERESYTLTNKSGVLLNILTYVEFYKKIGVLCLYKDTG